MYGSFGRPTDPPILLITGTGASMLWWEEGFCKLPAEGRSFVIRSDHRDTGRSVTYYDEVEPSVAVEVARVEASVAVEATGDVVVSRNGQSAPAKVGASSRRTRHRRPRG